MNTCTPASKRAKVSPDKNQLTLMEALKRADSLTQPPTGGEGGSSSPVLVREDSPELFSDDGDCTKSRDEETTASAGPSDETIVISDSRSPSSSPKVKSHSSSPYLSGNSPISIPDSSSSHNSDAPQNDGVPLKEISFGPSTYPILPRLQPSATHAVLFHPNIKEGCVPHPFPDKFKDVWDSNHVRMPCSTQSVYPVSVGASKEKSLLPRWDLIKQALTRPINTSHDLEEAILSYNSVYAKRWNFNALHFYFNQVCSDEERDTFFTTLLPKIISLALDLPRLVTHAVPLLKKQQKYSITLSQQQIACLLANAFLCTFPRRNSSNRTAEYASYPYINFNTLYGSPRRVPPVKINKLLCLFHYFTRVTSKMPVGVVTFQREVLATPPRWENSDVTLTSLHVDSRGTIEDNGHGMLQVDFANKYVGGGVLTRGCVQEEIRFLICPELMAAMLFTEELDSNECLIVSGVEQYSTYKGYAASFVWSGSHSDQTLRDKWGRRQTQVVAMDALKFRSYTLQFTTGAICRELNKSYCAFLSCGHQTPCGRSMAVATGNWGCGAFRGDSRLKALIQLMSASVAGRDMVYFTFGDKQLQKELCSLYFKLVHHRVTVGQIMKVVKEYQPDNRSKTGLYQFLETRLRLTEHQSHDSLASSVTDCATVEYSVS